MSCVSRFFSFALFSLGVDVASAFVAATLGFGPILIDVCSHVSAFSLQLLYLVHLFSLLFFPASPRLLPRAPSLFIFNSSLLPVSPMNSLSSQTVDTRVHRCYEIVYAAVTIGCECLCVFGVCWEHAICVRSA